MIIAGSRPTQMDILLFLSLSLHLLGHEWLLHIAQQFFANFSFCFLPFSFPFGVASRGGASIDLGTRRERFYKGGLIDTRRRDDHMVIRNGGNRRGKEKQRLEYVIRFGRIPIFFSSLVGGIGRTFDIFLKQPLILM